MDPESHTMQLPCPAAAVLNSLTPILLHGCSHGLSPLQTRHAAGAPLNNKLPPAEAAISPTRIGRLGRRALFGRSASDVLPPGTAVAAAAAAVVDAYERQTALQVP